LQFTTTTSSGPGGQHANKVETAVELRWDVENSEAISETEKERLLQKIASRLTKNNVFIMVAQDSRSQHKNKDIVIKRFLEYVREHLKVQKRRKKRRPSKIAKLKRLRNKKYNSEKKTNRQKPDY